MGHYSKLAILGMRSFGLIILAYALPMSVWGILRLGMGARVASDGQTPESSALLAWLVYAIAGLLLLLLLGPSSEWRRVGSMSRETNVALQLPSA